MEIFKQAVMLLKEGVKTMKEAMFEHSCKIEEACFDDECSNNCSSDDLLKDCQTQTEGTYCSFNKVAIPKLC